VSRDSPLARHLPLFAAEVSFDAGLIEGRLELSREWAELDYCIA
jgi:hypothetical protein